MRCPGYTVPPGIGRQGAPAVGVRRWAQHPGEAMRPEGIAAIILVIAFIAVVLKIFGLW